MVKSFYGIIVSHGDLSKELIKTTELIVGKTNNLIAVSNNELSLQGLISKVEEKVNSFSDKTIIIFVEMIGGSPYIAGRKIEKKYNNVFFISGVNIPMLISFCTKKESSDVGQLIEMLKKDAVRGIESV